jgi:hypothetical protein
MPAARQSADDRIGALEASVPRLNQAMARLQSQLDSYQVQGSPGGAGSGPPLSLALVEQTLGLLRSLYWQQQYPPPLVTPIAVADFDVCFDITLMNPAIQQGQEMRIQDTPLGCVEFLGGFTDNGSATFKICCVRRDQVTDCVASVDLIVHLPGLPNSVVYQETRTFTCRGRRFLSEV